MTVFEVYFQVDLSIREPSRGIGHVLDLASLVTSEDKQGDNSGILVVATLWEEG